MKSRLATFEDDTLIKLTLAGQGECFTVLMDRHLTTVKRRIRSLVPNPTDLDDVLQEILLKVWLHLSTFRSESSFRTWMTRVAINEALQSVRRGRCKRFQQSHDDFDTLASPVESPHESLARVEAAQGLRAAVAKLPAKHRQIVALCDFEQLSAQETAQALQSTIPTVKSRLFQARNMLSAALHGSRTQRRKIAA